MFACTQGCPRCCEQVPRPSTWTLSPKPPSTHRSFSGCDLDPSLEERSELSSLRDLSEGLDMRINYEIPDQLHHRAKAIAALEAKTLRDFIIEAIADAVEQREGKDRSGS